MNKKILLTVATISILGIGLLSSTAILAENTADHPNPMAALVEKIADKFGLNQEDVQVIFDEYQTERRAEMEKNREKRQAEMEARFEEQLSQAIEEGKITEEQKQLIIAKREELEANRQTGMKEMTDEERKTAREEERQELESWAEEKGIDLEYLMVGFGMRGHGAATTN